MGSGKVDMIKLHKIKTRFGLLDKKRRSRLGCLRVRLLGRQDCSELLDFSVRHENGIPEVLIRQRMKICYVLDAKILQRISKGLQIVLLEESLDLIHLIDRRATRRRKFLWWWHHRHQDGTCFGRKASQHRRFFLLLFFVVVSSSSSSSSSD